MDEIIIGEKKYISSKQAAKITGYAKDYVGQLCREGRVPSRLVGRSWYVLESAIKDHRFGASQPEPEKKKQEKKKAEPRAALPDTWESPRYEALPETYSESPLPPFTRAAARNNEGADEHDIHDAWKTWFDRFNGSPKNSPATNDDKEKMSEPVVMHKVEHEQKEKTRDDGQATVPLRVMSRYYPTKGTTSDVIADARRAEQEEPVAKPDEQLVLRGRIRIGIIIAEIVLTVIAVGFLAMAIIASGLLDNIRISSGLFNALKGISVYIK